MSPLLIAQLALLVLQKLPELIKLAEKAFSGSQDSGAAKKDFVMTSVGAAIDAAGVATGEQVDDKTRAAIVDVADDMVDTTVAAMKMYKVLTHEDPDTDQRVAPQAS